MPTCRECQNYLGEDGCQEQSYHEIRPGDAINEHCEDRFVPIGFGCRPGLKSFVRDCEADADAKPAKPEGVE